MNASPAAVPSTASTGGGAARATSCPSSSEDRPVGAECEADETAPLAERVELETVHDGELGLGRAVHVRERR